MRGVPSATGLCIVVVHFCWLDWTILSSSLVLTRWMASIGGTRWHDGIFQYLFVFPVLTGLVSARSCQGVALACGKGVLSVRMACRLLSQARRTVCVALKSNAMRTAARRG